MGRAGGPCGGRDQRGRRPGLMSWSASTASTPCHVITSVPISRSFILLPYPTYLLFLWECCLSAQVGPGDSIHLGHSKIIITLASASHSCASFHVTVSTLSRSAPPSMTPSITHPSILLLDPIGDFAGTFGCPEMETAHEVAAVPWCGTDGCCGCRMICSALPAAAALVR